MNTKLQDYALLAEIISAIAIVLSLVFVGLQVSDNSEVARSQVREAMLSADLSILQNYIDHPDVFEGFGFGGELSSKEQQRNAYFAMVIKSRENYWVQYQNGVLDERSFNSYMNEIIEMIVYDEFFRYRWSLYQEKLVKGFSEDVSEKVLVLTNENGL